MRSFLFLLAVGLAACGSDVTGPIGTEPTAPVDDSPDDTPPAAQDPIADPPPVIDDAPADDESLPLVERFPSAFDDNAVEPDDDVAVVRAGTVAATPRLRGVNISGGEYGKVDGKYGTNYIFPNNKQLDYYASKRMNVVRVPFKWERAQRKLGGSLDVDEVGRLLAVVKYAATKNVYVLLDLHNYARYSGVVIGKGTTGKHLSNFWWRLAGVLKGYNNVVYGIMNEPYGISPDVWAPAAESAIAGIRKAGARQLILVPGVSWTGAHSWYSSGNADRMADIHDPLNNWAIEMHQYLDSDSSGTHDTCVSKTVGSQRLTRATAWLEENGLRGFLGEFGTARNATCDAGLNDIVGYMESHSTEWLGWSYWAGGAWWGDYMFTIEPKSGVDRQQMDILEKFTAR